MEETTKSKQYSCCIFDMDGLLLDTETFYTDVQKTILARFGKEFSWELKAKMMGKKALDAAQTLVDELGLEGKMTPEAFITEREDMLNALFPHAQLMPGVERLLRHLKAHGVRMCVATSSHRRHFDLKTQKHGGLFALMDHVITGDMVKCGKPDPEIFKLAASKWAPAPPACDDCIVFEDAPTGVAAGLAAGMRVIMVPDPNLDPESTRQATEVLHSLEHFQPEKYNLPPF